MAKRQRRQHTREFKLEAVRLVVEQGHSVSSVAQNLDISRSLLQRWKEQFVKDGAVAFPGHGKMTPRDEEVRELKRKLARAERERDILKKALGYFAEDQK